MWKFEDLKIWKCGNEGKLLNRYTIKISFTIQQFSNSTLFRLQLQTLAHFRHFELFSNVL